jgi:hypothetical protein
MLFFGIGLLNMLIMKQYLLSIFLFFLVCNIGFGQVCVDLIQYQKELETIIGRTSLDSTLDKVRLTQIHDLLKPCTNKEDLMNMRNIFFKMDNSKPFKTTLLRILKQNNTLCIDITERKFDAKISISFRKILDSLINVNENEIKKGIRSDSKKTNLQYFKAMKKLLSDCTNLTDLEQLSALNKKISTKGFGEFTMNFVSNFREFLSVNINLLKTLPQEIIESNNHEGEEDEIVIKEKSSNIWEYISYILLGLVLIAGVAYGSIEIYKNQKHKKVASKNSRGNKSQPQKTQKTQKSQKLEKLEKDNEAFRKKNENIERELKDAKDEISQLKQKLEDIREADKTVPLIKTSKSRISNDRPNNNLSSRNSYEQILFFASPNEQGEFIAKNGQNEIKSGASIYKFEIKGADAKIEFFNHISTFQNTLNNPNRLNAVCNFVNDYNPDATKIKTEKKGKAILQGDKWKVIQKAEIRYEA